MRRGLALLVLAAACATSESERTRQASDRQAARESMRAAEVVQALVTSTSAGRLIYDRPADLSYDSLQMKRPDLVRAVDRPKR